MSKKIYTSENVKASGPYSHAVDAGNYIFFSGQTAMNGTEEHLIRAKGGIKEQTERALSYLESVMGKAGVTESDVVKVNVYLTSMTQFEEMNAAYGEFFSEPYPARTCVAVQDLPLHADVEIEAIAEAPQ